MNGISKATNISRFAGFSVPPEPLRRESRPPPPNDPPAVEIFQVFPHSKLAIWVGKMIAICEEVSKQMFLLGGSFWVRPFYFIQGTSTFVDMVQAIFWSCKSPPELRCENTEIRVQWYRESNWSETCYQHFPKLTVVHCVCWHYSRNIVLAGKMVFLRHVSMDWFKGKSTGNQRFSD